MQARMKKRFGSARGGHESDALFGGREGFAAVRLRTRDIKPARLFRIGDKQGAGVCASAAVRLSRRILPLQAQKGGAGLLRKGEKKGFFSAAARAKETHMV